MKKSKIKLVYSSHLSDEENTKFEEHIHQSIGVDHSIHLFRNYNEYSLSSLYNRALDELTDEESIIIFLHNDLLFDTNDWGVKLLRHFNNPNLDYQIIGVAGTTELWEHGCWWQTKNREGMNMSKMVGIVNHFNGIRKWESRYCEPFTGVKPVLLIDGLFIAVDPKEITSRFDERFNGFHYYDVPFSVSNYLDGCNVGVITDIRITHMSIGMTNNEWEFNRQLFTQHFADELPLTLEE